MMRMYVKSYGVESDGELFKMQQEAIRMAREMSRAATLPMQGHSANEDTYKPEPETDIETFGKSLSLSEEKPLESAAKRQSLLGGLFGGGKGLLGGFFTNIRTDDILLLVLLFLLITENADIEIILIIGFLLIVGFLKD